MCVIKDQQCRILSAIIDSSIRLIYKFEFIFAFLTGGGIFFNGISKIVIIVAIAISITRPQFLLMFVLYTFVLCLYSSKVEYKAYFY